MFKLVKILNRSVNVAEGVYLPGEDGRSYSIGEAVVVKNGAVAPVRETETPTYIVGASLASGGKDVFCYPVSPDMVFETTFSEAPSGLKVSDRVTLGIRDGRALSVSATKTNGVAEIYYMKEASGVGDTVLVRFN